MKRRLTQDPDDNLIYLTVEDTPEVSESKSRKKKKRVTWKELGVKEYTGEQSPVISKDFFPDSPEENPET